MASPSSNASRTPDTGGVAASSAPGTASNSRPAVDVTAVTTRDDFLLELGESLGGQAAVRPVESTGEALEHVSSVRRGQVLVIDSRDIADVRAEVERANAQAAHAVVLVFADPEKEKEVSAAVKGTNVLAVLSLPVDKRRTSAVFENALSEATTRKPASATERTGASVNIEPFQSRTSASGGDGEPEPNRKPLFLIAAVVAAVAVAGGAYMIFGRSGAQAPAPGHAKAAAAPAAASPPATPADDATLAPQPAVETSLIHGKVDELLERARQAMRDRHYSEPAGDNALLYYRSAAAADPTNGEAVDGLQRVAGVLAVRIEDAMNGNRLDEAGMALANLKQAAPTDSRIGSYELRLVSAQISKALADGNLDRAAALVRVAQQTPAIPPDQVAKWRAEITRRQEDAKVVKMAALISDRIRDGRLVEPADDSAKLYLQQLRDAAPTNAVTQRVARDLNSAYLRKAREAAVANHTQESDRWIAEARAGGVSASDLQSFQKEVVSARQKAQSAESDRLAQGARDRIRDGRLTDPAQDSAAGFISQIQSTDPANPALAPLSHDLAAKLIERARAEAQAGKQPLVDADLAQAKRFGADPKDILAVQQIAASPKSGTGTPRTAGGIDTASLAASLKRTRYTAPEYPSKALSQKISGAVTVEYTVDGNGDTRDARVIESTPPGIFDRAALSAVKHWHYNPVLVNGTAVEIPVRTAIRFELPN